MDFSHLNSLMELHHRAKTRLAQVPSGRLQHAFYERSVVQLEKEIKGERKFLGLPEDENEIMDISEDDLLSELNTEN